MIKLDKNTGLRDYTVDYPYEINGAAVWIFRTENPHIITAGWRIEPIRNKQIIIVSYFFNIQLLRMAMAVMELIGRTPLTRLSFMMTKVSFG